MKTDETRRRALDTGMALTLLGLIVFFFTRRIEAVYAATALLVLTMTFPMIFAGPARLWFGFSHLLGTVVSKILLSVVFFTVVTPMALFRRTLGKDSLRLREWHKGADTAFRRREHEFAAADFEKPY